MKVGGKLDILEKIKTSQIMFIKSGQVCIKAEERDWLIKTIEDQREIIKEQQRQLQER